MRITHRLLVRMKCVVCEVSKVVSSTQLACAEFKLLFVPVNSTTLKIFKFLYTFQLFLQIIKIRKSIHHPTFLLTKKKIFSPTKSK